MTFISILLALLSLSGAGSTFQKACYQKAFLCSVSCASQPGAAARDRCLDTCDSKLSTCLD